MSFITFTVPTVPIPKLRARHRHVKTKAGEEFTTSYTPTKTVKYEQAVALFCKSAMRGQRQLTGALSMEVRLYLPIPKSWSKKQKAAALAGLIHHTTRPDCSNVNKAIEDALNDVLYADDCAIVSSTVSKRYSDTPRAEVTVGQIP